MPDRVRNLSPHQVVWLQQKLVRAAFFLWLSVLNLMCLSTLWARAADLFSSEAATRLFGFLGAGATCGAHTLHLCSKPLGYTHSLP